MTTRDDIFMENQPHHVISGFPYVERYCKYCNNKLKIYRAMHIQDQLEHYKAVLICDNRDCEAYDEECREAYVRVYYSSQFAFDKLSGVVAFQDPRSLYPDLLRKS